jgi:hypothetical protein
MKKINYDPYSQIRWKLKGIRRLMLSLLSMQLPKISSKILQETRTLARACFGECASWRNSSPPQPSLCTCEILDRVRALKLFCQPVISYVDNY